MIIGIVVAYVRSYNNKVVISEIPLNDIYRALDDSSSELQSNIDNLNNSLESNIDEVYKTTDLRFDKLKNELTGS